MLLLHLHPQQQPLPCALGAGEAPQAKQEPTTVEWPLGELDTLDAQAFYLQVVRLGIEYGPHFRMVCKTSADGQTAVLRFGGPSWQAMASSHPMAHGLHRATLSMLQ